jgi:hypothetical protein
MAAANFGRSEPPGDPADAAPIEARGATRLEWLGCWARHNKGLAAAPGMLGLVLLVAAISAAVVSCGLQSPGENQENARAAVRPPAQPMPPAAYIPPKRYVCYRASGPLTIDGRLDKPAWQAVPWTEDFVDIEGDVQPRPRFRTRAKMLWDDRYFYIAAELEEPHLQATFTTHDSYIFHEDNDFEVFINPNGDNHNYAELEMNALNTTWDLLLKKPYRDGGKGIDSWEIEGLKTAVRVHGTLNNPADVDRGWTVEIAIPFAALEKLWKQPMPPRDGDQWRVNFSRVEWRFDVVDGKYRRLKNRREDNWVWSPQWAVNMHRPETWGYVQFSTAPIGKGAFRPDPGGPAKHILHRIYYAQGAFYDKHRRFAGNLAELGLENAFHESLVASPAIELTPDGYNVVAVVRYPDGTARRWRIRDDSLVEMVSPKE